MLLDFLLWVPILFIGFLFGRARRASKMPKHDHTWVSRSVHQTSLYENDHSTRPMRRYTTVLQTCFCSESRTKVLEGHWDLEDLV